MNLTLAVDDRVVEEARRAAESMGKSLNQVVREYLEHLATPEDIEADITELRKLSEESPGNSSGWRFNREEIHERS